MVYDADTPEMYQWCWYWCCAKMYHDTWYFSI